MGVAISPGSQAQVPEGYYDRALQVSGAELKDALHEIIRGHKAYPYTASTTDVWDILKETDRDTANPENVILFYSGWSVNAAQEYNSGKGWTRESVWATSHGNLGTSKGAGTDVHHIRPADHSVNSARNNKDFDVGGNPYIDGDGPTGCFSDADSWEPRDAVKGDVARMLFYMAVRYEGTNGEPDLELVDEVNTMRLNEPGKGFHGKLSALLSWHQADPPDSLERKRNDIIYTYQGNRNPFIDHPEFVGKIWKLTSAAEVRTRPFTVYPNPASSLIYIRSASVEAVQGEVLSLSGHTVKTFEFQGMGEIPVSHLGPGVYIISVMTGKAVFSEKLVITAPR